MQAVISHSLIQRLAPSDKPYEVRDTRLKGLLLRVQPSGVMTFYVEYARGRRVSVGRAEALAPTVARKRAKQILSDAYIGRDPMASQRQAKARSFGDFVEAVYRPWAEQNIRTAGATVRRLKGNFPEFQAKKLNDITPWLVEKWRMRRLKSGTKPTTVNRDLDDLKAALAKATTWGLIEAHPLTGVKRLRTDDNPRVRYLTEDEERCLLAAIHEREARIRRRRSNANQWRTERGYPLLPDLEGAAFADHLKPLVLVSLHTGLRRGELFALTWENVDLPAARITIIGARAKSGRTRHMPINAVASNALAGWYSQAAETRGLVFPGKNGKQLDNVRAAWLGVLKIAHVEGFRWHDLRHTFASRLVMAGVDLNTVRELLGHASYQMTLRYAHLAPEHKAAAVAKLVERT